MYVVLIRKDNAFSKTIFNSFSHVFNYFPLKPDGVSVSVVENIQNMETNEGTYFGVKEYCESIKWTHQFPLVRQDDAFEKMALRTSR